MADGTTDIRDACGVHLREGVGEDRHLVAVCCAPECGRVAPCDPTPWFEEGLGTLPLRAFSYRLRCICGCRQARLEVRPGPYEPAPKADLYIFH